jgi:hypothetical protein
MTIGHPVSHFQHIPANSSHLELFGGNWFLAALSSSRSLVVRPLVGPSVGWSVGHLYEK